ncbi:MAG: hypothetical protein QG653_615 [Patescibacteria group bacterium]|nr:hypothetical protein [Patescibacteria group bacterium]
MESNHTFAKKELTTDDNNFKPFTGELPSRLQKFAERALARYEKMSPALREHFTPALNCINTAVLRTSYSLDLKNTMEIGDAESFDTKDSFLTPKFNA